MMGDDKSARSLSPMGGRDRDLELLIPVSGGSGSGGSPSGDDDVDRTASSSASAALSSSGREAFHKVVRSWASKKFMTGCVILFPIAITFYFTWWFIHFVDGFFSPIYAQLGINIFGLGFITSVTFIFFVGVFMSSWVGASVLGLGEWIIKRMPLVRHIYNASKQISAAISPDQNKQAFKEAVIIRHPRVGEYAFGFITSSVSLQSYAGQEELYCVYVPTNHLYIGDIFMVNSKDVIRPNLSVREGIEIVVSGGMSMPQILSTLDPHTIHTDRSGASRS
ncbi:protein LIKE COV 1-like [Lolium rigidum]|uniref:protein LIKE COV 1-like n=1 Tax=Lolium rigidum TaxID=89674 RepID=UPI001F5C5F66|nr:protein LIKE COV 1-like [Lolium rigidum]